MTLKLRRPMRSANRPRFAEGGAVSISPTPPIQRVEDRPEPAHKMAARALRDAGVAQPTAPQKAHVAQAVARDRTQGGGNTGAALAQAAQMHEPGFVVPPHIRDALDLRPAYARGGSIAPGLPAAPFASIPTPSIATPGLASPRALTSAHHRTHFAAGGAIPAHIMAALALRPHFDDGGDAGGGGDSSHSSSSSSSGGDGGGGDNSGDGHGSGSDSSSSSSSSGSAGGVGGFGGGGSDGYGGGSSSSSSSVGGHSDASTGGADNSPAGGSSSSVGSSSVGSTTSSGGFSSGAASGADSGGDGGSVGNSAVGSIGGSYGAPAAGGFSNEGAPATGGFGNFGATPSATTSASLTGATPSASMMSGQTASQSMANEAANSAGEAGEDGTAGLGAAPSTGQAFSNFGPAPASPYGSLANAQQSFGAQPDGTTGTVPGSVAASNIGALNGLSPSATQFGMMGPSGVDASQVSVPSGVPGLGAYGMSTMNPNGSMPGFDNFNAAGSVQQSSLGAPGFGGTDAGSVNPAGSYSTPSGVQTGALTGAMQGGLPSAEGYVGSYAGLTPTVAAALAATTPQATAPGFTPDYGTWNGLVDGVDQTKHPGYVAYGPNGPISNAPTSATPGLNADGDPTAVNGVSALTVHGTLSPSAQAMSDGVPSNPTGAGLPSGVGMNDGIAQTAYGAMTTPGSLPAYARGEIAQPTFSPASADTGQGTADAPVGLGVAPAATPAAAGLPTGDVFGALHQIEGGVLNGQVDPNNPTHYGPAQFSQDTFSDTARQHADLGIDPNMSMFSATPEQYANITQAHWSDIGAALTAAGLADTPGNRYAGWNLGVTGGIRALSAGPDATLAQAGISPSVQAANPSIYGGVSTVGQLQAKLDGMFSGSGTTTGATPTSDAATSVGNFGVDQIAASVPTQTGPYGTTLAHDYSTTGAPSPQFAHAATTAHDAPGVTAFGGMSAGYANYDGSIPNESMATPSSMQGYTDFSGNPVDFGSPSPSTTDTDTGTKHLSVPNFAGNAIGGMAASAVLGGPIGLGVGAANAVSGLLGGPTMADGINAVLAHPGAPSSVTGGGDNSNQPGSDSSGSAMPAPYNPGSPGTTDTAATTSTGVNPLDPHATATAAYEAALAGMGQPGAAATSQSGTSDDTISGYRHALWIRGSGHHALNTAPASPLYNPMQDQSVLHALGLD